MIQPRRRLPAGLLALLLVALLILLVGFLVLLIALLVVVLIIVLIIVLITIILVFLIHCSVPPEHFVGYRVDSMACFSGFIPGTKNQSG